MSPSFSSGRFSVALFLVISAVPIAYLISLERAVPSTHVFSYQSSGFFRECAKWDDAGRRFLVSFMDGGGIGEVVPSDGGNSDDVLREITLVKDVDLAGNASLGIVIDRRRNRLLVAVADLLGNRYSALAAYDMSTWRRVFLAELSGQSGERSFADDVAVDAQGNAYVTDAKGSKIWKVDVNGKIVSTIESPLFTPPGWYNNLVALNGIVYHPDGFLIVIHTFSGLLYKIDLTAADGDDSNSKVSVVGVTGGTLRFGDGLELLSPTKIVVAVFSGSPSAKLVESSDGWRTATVTGWFSTGMVHRIVSSATVKEGRVYLNHIVGFGSKKRHILVEAVF
ncbi:uncharacterized protein LOC108806524 isoform X1 [Raphanus sativus]|uniref:Uncharacterized protein LOC108806524 isoform X1 n=1 Tax=Raphanus sativus TaxID=3726 RepID=A0A9W3C1X8_RAPSA|nr:uncharacterized protein LOC108806524 isoform X1 [Raphanus sativus]